MLKRYSAKTKTVSGLMVVLAGMTGLVAYSPTLYQWFCDVTGYGGTVQRAEVEARPQSISSEEVTIRFDANVGGDLPWEFKPEQRTVTTRFGEPVQAYYRAKNLSDEPIVARAVFNVTPYQAAQYFFKIECFCFTNERLEPGEEARMPLVVYIDQQMLNDENTETVREVTLSYTFYKQDDLSPEEFEAARGLKVGSEELDADLEKGALPGFDNDAPRR